MNLATPQDREKKIQLIPKKLPQKIHQNQTLYEDYPSQMALATLMNEFNIMDSESPSS